jgi:hypothetical protein
MRHKQPFVQVYVTGRNNVGFGSEREVSKRPEADNATTFEVERSAF